MSESLNVLKTGRYEARVKGRSVTILSEADRQREEWNLSNEAQRSRRETTGMNENESICSIVSSPLSNEVNGYVEPVGSRRRQHQISVKPAWISGYPGVSGHACGEGYSREDGRSCLPPVRGIAHMTGIKSSNASTYHVCNSPEVNPPITGREVTENGEQEVRQAHSRDETPVMGADPKEPDFCKRFPNSLWLSELSEREREDIEHERKGQ